MSDLIKEKQDLTYLEWSKIRHSSGTAGSFLKATSEIFGKKIYYKLSDYDSVNGVTGTECINELIVDRLLAVLGVNHLSYKLIFADITVDGKIFETYLCASEDFKKKGEEKVALDAYYETEKEENETPLMFCERMGFSKYVYEMFVVDFLILNRDRHGANIEVLKNPKSKTIRLAPLFDHGLSLLTHCNTGEAIKNFDVMADKPVQSYLGSNSAYNNLKLIPKNAFPELKPLKPEHKNIIFDGLYDVSEKQTLEKIWDMIWKRWSYYEDFRNQK